MKKNSFIDTHVHFWNPDLIKYDWLESVPPLNRPFLLQDFNEVTQNYELSKMVFVECDCQPDLNEAEVKWIYDLADADPRIEAIVAHVDLTDVEGVSLNLERITSYEMVRGIRHLIQGHEKGFALQPAFINGLAKVAAHNRHFELCITHDQMDDCIELINKLPEMPLMLDHCGKPGIRDSEIDRWKMNLKMLSEFDHLHCKISGLLTEADHEHWTSEQITPYMDYVRQCFGIDRIMYGGDWPVCTLAGGYKKWFELVEVWTSSWSDAEKVAFYSDNAMKFYRL